MRRIIRQPAAAAPPDTPARATTQDRLAAGTGAMPRTFARRRRTPPAPARPTFDDRRCAATMTHRRRAAPASLTAAPRVAETPTTRAARRTPGWQQAGAGQPPGPGNG